MGNRTGRLPCTRRASFIGTHCWWLLPAWLCFCHAHTPVGPAMPSDAVLQVAFFLEAPPPTASGSRRGDRGEGATHLMNLDTEGSMLAGRAPP